MEQAQIDQISNAFSNAYQEFFGMPIQYIPFDRSTVSQNKYEQMYAEADLTDLNYNGTEAVTFNGSISYNPEKKELDLLGFDPDKVSALITVVTKELVDGGIISAEREISYRDKIRINDRFNNETDYIITEIGKSVQFSDNFVFTKIGVIKEDSP